MATTSTDFEPRLNTAPLADIEAQLTTLAAHINAAMYRFLRLVAEFDRRQGWEGPGVLSCAHWLNWRCGIALSAAREKVRVAHALPALPRVAAAFSAGELSYSKVRAITRIGTPDNEAYLLQIARHGTAAHLEKLVRGYRRSVRLAEAEHAEAAFARRYLQYYYDEDGSLVINGRLPPELGALLVKALDGADQALRADGNIEAHEANVRGVWRGAEPAPSAPATACGPEAGAVSESTSRSVSTDASAEASSDRADPEPPTLASFEERRADALALLAHTWLTRAQQGVSNADAYQVMLHVDAGAYADRGEGRSEAEDGPPIAIETLRRLGCDVGVLVAVEDDDGHVMSIGRKSRAIPPALRRALRERDCGCRFPGCTATHYVQGHHLEHWAAGGETRLDNLVLLCWRHHRLVHEGGWTIEVSAEGGIEFRSPHHYVVPYAPPLPPATETIEAQNARAGLSITADTAIPHWHGEPLDLSLAVSFLWPADATQSPAP